MKYYIFIIVSLLLSTSLHARDLVVLKDNKCNFYTGLILDVSESVTFVNTKGKLYEFQEEQLDTILTYGISQTPFLTKSKFSKKFKNHFRKISFRDNTESITGIPFQYIEDLIFVLSDQGKVIVISSVEIKDIDSLEEIKLNISKNKEFNADYSEQAIECGQKYTPAKNAITPIRVLGDNLKISEYLGNYQKGARRFKDLEERTVFYTKPYLYPRRNRMGITQVNSQKQAMPFYYQWATGKDFHFQSLNQFGGTLSKYLPSYETNTIFSSEFKSHFFHGFFEGNLTGLSAGSIPGDFTIKAPNKNMVINNFNYFAFMGGDWKNFSFSYGGGYFTPYFNLKKYESREIAANSISRAIKFGYSSKKWKLHYISYLMDDKSSSSFDISDQVKVESQNGVVDTSISKYEYKSSYHRVSGEWGPLEDVSFLGDILVGDGSYEEDGTDRFYIDFKSSAYLLGVMKKFGHYITLTILMKSETYEMDSTLNSTNKSFESSNTSYGGRFELLF